MKYTLLLLAIFSSLSIGCAKKKPTVARQQPTVVPKQVPTKTPVSAPVATNVGSTLSAQEVQSALALHNQIRANVGVAPLTWSAKAAAHIQNWVNHLAATRCSLEHRPNNQYGENLFMGTAGYYGVDSAVQSWESEKANYHGEPLGNGNLYAVGHYTQVVWRGTTQVGCAKAICQNNIIIGCNYEPAGNFFGQKPY
jgi:pathogenesis-related protein 1